MTFFVEHCRTKNAKYFCHPPFHPPIFCCHSLKLLSPTLPKLMNWILLSPPPLSSDPDTPQNLEHAPSGQDIDPFTFQNIGLHTSGQDIDSLYFCNISASILLDKIYIPFTFQKIVLHTSGQDITS